MLNNMMGGMLDLEQIIQEQLMLQVQEETLATEPTLIVTGPAWLDEPDDSPGGNPPETDGWMCPRCRSHRCIRTNPGDLEHATFTCAVCGYTFEPASAARLPDPSE